jgi:hypothetical protein
LGHPLIWDEKDNKDKTYHYPTLTHPALEGEHIANGVRCHPAFYLLKELLKQYKLAYTKVAEIRFIKYVLVRNDGIIQNIKRWFG